MQENIDARARVGHGAREIGAQDRQCTTDMGVVNQAKLGRGASLDVS